MIKITYTFKPLCFYADKYKNLPLNNLALGAKDDLELLNEIINRFNSVLLSFAKKYHKENNSYLDEENFYITAYKGLLFAVNKYDDINKSFESFARRVIKKFCQVYYADKVRTLACKASSNCFEDSYNENEIVDNSQNYDNLRKEILLNRIYSYVKDKYIEDQELFVMFSTGHTVNEISKLKSLPTHTVRNKLKVICDDVKNKFYSCY